ncbi:MAG TPA: sn-glycerol-3-phosphate ABC transporter ATP-binding protein UgpC [Polaromonas sp.]|uniref:ABC transporter ATP-binding protein n=1 Tax=Polaromonas sp. TaxID=1869339 RepID=UPI002D5C37AC|nr:sn-glycerol-3-phosphate ABC transporter ATP-binding protein UgpC [Polaromonas sp.]HYW55565.1 sn-glycerol-3-phosphate ABC transporter ATP-binding protein UgpC [Polaromonas sp.]
MAQLELKGIVKSFQDATVIHGVNLTVEDGEFCVFVGPSGCGKSTLLRMIAGLEECTDGAITIDGEDVTDHQPAKRGIAMVFQSYALYPHMTVRENMGFGLKIAKVPEKDISDKVAKAAKTLQIEHLLDRRPKDLSGGQRQRVAIGRAIVREPRMFLFDEPLSNLDAALRVEMRIELAKIKSQLNTTVVYVTHDQVEAMTLADKIVVLRDGLIEQVGKPLDLYTRPANQFVAGFIGSPKMNFLSGVTHASGSGQHEILLKDGARLAVAGASAGVLGKSVVVGVRPEHLHVGSKHDAGLSGEVVVAERLGGESYFHVRVGDKTLIAKAPGDSPVELGERVGLRFDADKAHLFEPDGGRLN